MDCSTPGFLSFPISGWVKSLSRIRLFGSPWTVAYQAPPSMGFSRQEYWSGLPFPSPGDLPDPGIEPGPPALQADAFTISANTEVPSPGRGIQRCYVCYVMSLIWMLCMSIERDRDFKEKKKKTSNTGWLVVKSKIHQKPSFGMGRLIQTHFRDHCAGPIVFQTHWRMVFPRIFTTALKVGVNSSHWWRNQRFQEVKYLDTQPISSGARVARSQWERALSDGSWKLCWRQQGFSERVPLNQVPRTTVWVEQGGPAW